MVSRRRECRSRHTEQRCPRQRRALQFFAFVALTTACDALSLHGSATPSWCNEASGASVATYAWDSQSLKSTAFSSIGSSSFVSATTLLRPAEDMMDIVEEVEEPQIYRRTFIKMGKGDGKKRRKKKSASSPSASIPSEPAASSPQPMRVTSDSNISVKRQIRWAKMNKEYQKSGTSFRQKKVVKTKYRRTWDEEEIEEKKIERSKRGQEPDWEVILNRTASSPLFIVDGYNVIHKWPRLKKWMVKGQLSRARDTLVHDLEELRRIKGWRIECVFDGAGRAKAAGPLGSGPGSSEVNARVTAGDATNKKQVTSHGVRIVYSGAGESADSYIEHRCFEAKKVTGGELTGSLIVASDDGMIRLAGTNAGALCMSSGRLVDELKAVRGAIMHRVEVAVAEANGHGVRPSALHGTAAPGRFVNKMIIVDKRKKKEKKTGDDMKVPDDD